MSFGSWHVLFYLGTFFLHLFLKLGRTPVGGWDRFRYTTIESVPFLLFHFHDLRPPCMPITFTLNPVFSRVPGFGAGPNFPFQKCLTASNFLYSWRYMSASRDINLSQLTSACHINFLVKKLLGLLVCSWLRIMRQPALKIEYAPSNVNCLLANNLLQSPIIHIRCRVPDPQFSTTYSLEQIFKDPNFQSKLDHAIRTMSDLWKAEWTNLTVGVLILSAIYRSVTLDAPGKVWDALACLVPRNHLLKVMKLDQSKPSLTLNKLQGNFSDITGCTS